MGIGKPLENNPYRQNKTATKKAAVLFYKFYKNLTILENLFPILYIPKIHFWFL